MTRPRPLLILIKAWLAGCLAAASTASAELAKSPLKKAIERSTGFSPVSK